MREIARAVIKSRKYNPVADPRGFQRRIAELQMAGEALPKLAAGRPVFLDRGLFDGTAYCRVYGREVPAFLANIHGRRYTMAFLLEPLPLRKKQIASRMMAELDVGLDKVSKLGRPGVSIFSTARCRPGSPLYERTYRIGCKVAEAGFAVFEGGGPGGMEAAARGALATGSSTPIGEPAPDKDLSIPRTSC